MKQWDGVNVKKIYFRDNGKSKIYTCLQFKLLTCVVGEQSVMIWNLQLSDDWENTILLILRAPQPAVQIDLVSPKQISDKPTLSTHSDPAGNVYVTTHMLFPGFDTVE